MTTPTATRRGLFLAVAACLFASGAGSLMLEVVWSRLLRLVFGSTTLAVSTVLVAYMLGLGLGGLLAGRRAARWRNGVRVYGFMEIGIALYALAVPWLFRLLPALNEQFLATLSFWPAALVRFVAVLLVLIVPTMLMGATLPVLVAALAQRRADLARRVGLLYGLNTLGAVTGVFLATFVLFAAVGLQWTNTIAALLDLGIGLVAAFVIAPALRTEAAVPGELPKPSSAPPVAARRPPAAARAALATYAVVGFTSLAYEVCWTRALSMVLGSSIYAFAVMLAAFLSGIALGSLIARRWFDRLRKPFTAYGIGLLLLGALALAAVIALRQLPELFPRLFVAVGLSRFGIFASSASVALLAMIGPTLVMGALFPLLVRSLAEQRDAAAAAVGDVYFANTIGAALGAFAAGFILIPAIGLRLTMALCIALNFAAAASVLLSQRETSPGLRWGSGLLAAAAALLVLGMPPAWNEAALARGVYRYPGEELDVGVAPLPLRGVAPAQMLYYHEGINTTVSVHRQSGLLHLRVNGKVDGSSGRDMATQTLSGHIPMLFGQRADEVLVIGLATGVTAGAVSLHEPERLDIAELEPAMVEVSRYFEAVNHAVLQKPRVRLIADDARALLAQSRRQYDVIISEPSNPWITGAASLFTAEFFELARQRLRPGGRLLQWVQLYGMYPDALASVLAALHSRFPYIYGFAWESGVGDLLLMAMDRPLTAEDLPRWERLPPAIQNDLIGVGTNSTHSLWSLLRLTDRDIAEVAVGAARINNDDNLYVELSTPWAIYDIGTIEQNWQMLGQHRGGLLSIVPEPFDAEMIGAVGLGFAERNDAAMAAEYVRQAEQRGSSAHAMVVKALLDLHAHPERGEAALHQLDQAVALQPQAPAVLYYRAWQRVGQLRYAGALDDLDALVQLTPGDMRARYLRAQALAALDRNLEARQEIQRVLHSSYVQVDPEVWAIGARIAAAVGNLPEAIREQRRFLELRPEHANEWGALSSFYRQSGETAAAQQAMDNALQAQRNVVLSLHQRALRAERMGRVAQARLDLQRAVQVDHSYHPAQRDLERINRKGEGA